MEVKIDLDLINEKLSYYKKEFALKEFMENIKKIRAVWKQELEPVIIGSLPDFEVVEKDLRLSFS